MTQAELAEEMEVAEQTVRRAETFGAPRKWRFALLGLLQVHRPDVNGLSSFLWPER